MNESKENLEMSLLNYFILLLSTVAWIVIMFLPICEFIQAKVLSIIIRKYFQVNSCQFKVDYFSISFCTFCITLRNLKIWIENVGYVEFEEMKIRLNDLKMWKNKGSSVSKRAFCVKFTRTTFHLFQENFMENLSFYQNALSLLEISILKDCFFDMDKIVLFFNSTSQKNSSLVIEIDRSTFAYEQFVINDSNASNILLDRLNHQGSLKLNVITAQILNSCFYFIEHNWMHEQASYQHNVEKILKFFKLEESKFQVNFGDLPTKYSDKNGNELYLNPSSLIDMTSYSELEINVESSCQELVEDFLETFQGMNQCLEKDFLILARLNLSRISLNFLNANNLLFNLKFSMNSAIRIDFSKGITLESVLKFVSFSTFLNKQSLLQIDEILVSLNITKNYTNVHISSVSELNLILYNLMPNLNLFFLWNTSLKSFLKHDIDIVIDLNSCSAKLPCIYERKYLTVNFNKINLNLSKKIDFNRKILIVMKNAKLFSPSLDSFYSIKSERIVIESIETHDDHKLQVLFAPIIFSKETNQISSDNKTIYSCDEINSTHSFQSYLYTCNASELIEPNDENDKIFNTNNAIYLIVFQLRFHRFKSKNQSYSYQFEFVLGDIFGSVNSFNLSQVMSLASNFWEYFQFEKDAYIFILNNAIWEQLSYVSVRVITSLTQLNVLKNSNEQSQEFVLFNLTLSPLNYAFCDFHFGNDTSGTLGSMPDLCLKMFCSVKSEINHVTDTIIVECGTLVVNYLSLIEHEKINEARLKTKIEFLKMNDSETKRLYFLWNFDQDECGCRGNALFFSNSNEIHMLYDFDKDHIVKPCIYDISSNADKYGFGQSIITPNEMTFFSYRSFNDDKTNKKISPGQEFVVLANLENDEPLSKPKYDPFQIIVYENELNKFNNESLSFDFLNKLNAENLNYNSASMTPPYFTKEFSIYIRYLPVIRNVAKVTHIPRKNDFKIVLKDSQANIPYSDLKDGLALWNKLKTRRNAIDKIELPNQVNATYKNKEVSKKLITKQKLKQLQKLNNNNNNNDYGLLSKSKVKLKQTSATFPAKMTENLSPYYLNFLPILNLNLVQIRNGFKLENRANKKKKICVHEVFLQCFLNAYQTKFLEENLKKPIFDKVNLALNEDNSTNEGFLLNQNKNLMNIKYVTVLVTPIIMDRMQKFIEIGNQDLPLNENGFEHFDEMVGEYSKNIATINIFFLNSTTIEKKSVNQIVQLSLRNLKIFTCHRLEFSKELYFIDADSIWLNSNVNFHEKSTEKFPSNKSYMEFWKSFLQPCVHFNLIKFYFKIVIKRLIISHADSSQINIPQIAFYALSTNQTLNLSLELFDWRIENPFSIIKMFTFAKMFIKVKNYFQMQAKSILNYSFKINFRNIEAALQLNERLDLNMCIKELQIFVSRSNRLKKFKIQTECKIENNSLFSTQFKIFNVLPEENVLIEVQTNVLKINSSFQSKLLCSAISEIEFPLWVVGKFYFDKQLFQILDINLPSLDFDHENKKILFKFESVRFARTNLSIRQTDLIENLLNEVLSEPLGYSFQILIKRLSIVYFSPNLNSEEWYLMVLNNFKSNYSFKVENENKTEILTIEFVGRQKETRKCKHTFDHDKSGCFLIKNSLNANNLFTQNDNRKWLDLVTSASFKNKSQAMVIFTDCCFKFCFFSALKTEKINWNLEVKDSIEILLNKDLFKKFCLIFLRPEFRKSQNYENFNGQNLQRTSIHLYDFNRSKLKLSNHFECFNQKDFAFLYFTHCLTTCSKLQKFLTFINKNSLA